MALRNNGDVVLLYAHPTMHKLAMQIAECCHNSSSLSHATNSSTLTNPSNSPCVDSKVVASDPSHSTPDISHHPEVAHKNVLVPARHVEFRNTIQWKNFEDGFPNLFIEDVKYMAGKDVIFIGSFHSPAIVFEQLSVLYAFPRYLARSFHFILPYFPTGTMERVDTEGQIATAKTLATLLSSIPLSARGPAQIMIYDIHALQERFYFSDNVIPRLETAIPLLQRELATLPDKENLVFAFPDDGAYKRFHLMFPDDERLIVCAKKRIGDNKKVVTVKDGHPSGKHVIIVDDLVQSGGTIKECAKVLLEHGATAVSAYVTHAVFPCNSWENFLDSDPPFANFWITNSIPHAEEISKHPPFKLLSLSSIITEHLLGFDLVPTH